MATHVPTLEDAQAAAEIVAASGATRVLLFGSLARGEAHEFSDIDLVAMFDDIDYSKRKEIEEGLKEQIKDRVGVDNDVIVTDRPEWKARAEGDIPTCFEADISLHAVPLIDKPPSEPINWEKPMSLPVSRVSESSNRINEISHHWVNISKDSKTANDEERREWLDNRDHNLYLFERDWRFRDVCGESHLVIEGCLKLLLSLYCVKPPRNILSHNTFDLTNMLRHCAPEQADTIEGLRGTMSHKEISFWHVARNYERVGEEDVREFEATKERTAALIHVAERMTSHALAEHKKVAGAKNCGNRFYKAQRISAAVALRINKDGDGLDPPDLPGDIDPDIKVAGGSKTQSNGVGVFSFIRKVFGSRTSTSSAASRVRVRRCGKRRADGKPCRQLLKPGSRCPHHPY